MDREADSYAILFRQRLRHQVVQDRVLADEESHLRETAKAAKRSFDREVPLRDGR
jgi:hypothetical protein